MALLIAWLYYFNTARILWRKLGLLVVVCMSTVPHKTCWHYRTSPIAYQPGTTVVAVYTKCDQCHGFTRSNIHSVHNSIRIALDSGSRGNNWGVVDRTTLTTGLTLERIVFLQPVCDCDIRNHWNACDWFAHGKADYFNCGSSRTMISLRSQFAERYNRGMLRTYKTRACHKPARASERYRSGKMRPEQNRK